MYKLAKKLKKTLFHLIITVLIVFGGYLSYANLERGFAIETVHVFPSQVFATGWENFETITFQNLDEYALLQDFNTINSATLVSNFKPPPSSEFVETDSQEDAVTNTSRDSFEDVTEVPSQDFEDLSSVSSSTLPVIDTEVVSTSTNSQNDTGSSELTIEDEVEDEPQVTDDAQTENQTDVEPQEEIEVETDSASSNSSSTALLPVNKHYPLVLFGVTKAFASTTETEPASAVETTTASVDNSVSIVELEEDTSEDPSFTFATDTPPEVSDVADENLGTTISEENPVSEDVSELVEQNTASAPDISSSSELVEENTSEQDVPIETETDIQTNDSCGSDCAVRSLLLSDFGFPIDEGVRISGAQLRVSLAAAVKERAEYVPVLEVRFSFNEGMNWEAAGMIALDEEVSNSINGGYFLFALPEFSDTSVLESLQVELVYKDDPSLLESLYIDSAWLELFTLTPQEETPLSEFTALEDDGYFDGLLSGDQLQLPNGTTINISETDNNDDETLIIKTDKTTYDGLSEATTYVSVTNESNSVDSFTLQTYFPNGVGEVLSLEEYNVNKPREVVVPEYRPYVFHCEAGWETAASVDVDTIEELSQQLLFPTGSTEPENNVDVSTESSAPQVDETVESIGSSTESAETDVVVEFAVLSSTTTQTADENSNATSTEDVATTTISQRLPDARPLTQSSTTIPTDIGTFASSSPQGSVEPDAAVYSCRNTNVVQSCDYIDGDNTACHVSSFKVTEHDVTKYAPGFEQVALEVGEMPRPNFVRSALNFIGFGPDRKQIPDRFEVRSHTDKKIIIQPGETKYFKMEIGFPAHTSGEYWIEAVGEREYGLLDPFWSSDWTYRMPIQVTNPTSQDQTEYQVFFELDSGLSDFWSNVNSDGSDIRFVQEVASGNFSNADTAVNNWLDFDFSHRLPITIPAGSVDADLTNFPISIDLSSLGSEFWSNVRSDGGDVRVYTTDGTEVAIDLAYFDNTATQGELHFLASSVPAAAATTYYLYYGDSTLTGYTATDPLGAQAVWVNYNAVYHFTDDPTSIGNIVSDVTGNGHDLEVFGDVLATTTGQYGLAVDMTGTGSGYLASTTWTFPGGDPLIVTGSYYMTAFQNEGLFEWGNGEGGRNQIEYRPWYNASNGLFYFGVTSGATYITTPQATTTWHGFGLMGTTSTAGENVVFENGVEVERVAQTVTNASNTVAFEVGREGGGSINAFIDELRIATSTRSEARIKAESIALDAPEQLYTLQPIQTPDNAASLNWYSTSWGERIKISIPGARLQEDVTDFPVYVDLANFDSQFFVDVASDGRDIRVTTGDGVTEVPIEIVDIDTGAETGELYFKANLSRTSANDFYVYYSNDDTVAYARADIYGSENVWTNRYEAVYHLEEDAVGTGNTDVYLDSTDNEYHGDDENASDSKAGLFGRGQEFGDTQVDYLSLPYQVLDGLTDTTVSWWHISSTTGDQTIISGANSGQANELWTRLDNNTLFRGYYQGGQETFTLDDPSTYNDDTWQHMMWTSEDAIDEMNFYLNGEPDNENPDPQPVAALNIDSGGLIIGQDQDVVGGNFSTAENFEGLLDELRFASVVRSAGWAAAVYENMANQTSFVSVEAPETLQATDFVELDFWVQHFDNSADEADIWVQVADLPAGDETVIYLYYGNSGASSASDEEATFTYSNMRELYYVVDNSGADDIDIISLIDGNEVSVDGVGTTTLDFGEPATFSTFDGTSVLRTRGPISATVSEAGNDNHDSVAPISFATTTHVGATSRNANRWYVYAPFASTTISAYIAAAGAADQVISVATTSVGTLTTDPTDSGATLDGDGVVIEATSPVLAFHRTTAPGDGYVLYPPTKRDLFGFDSNYAYTGAVTGGGDIDYYCSGGGSGTESSVGRGERRVVDGCVAGTQMTGDSVRLTAQDEPITAQQQADSDGREATAFWPQMEFGTRYAITNDAQYVAVVCSPRFGTTSIEIRDATDAAVVSADCTPTATDPGAVHFGGTSGNAVSYTAGHTIVSTNDVPFYVAFEDVTYDGEEKNILGTVQARQFAAEYATFAFGSQELAFDSDWEQTSFWWYQNGDVLTPTSTWLTGSEPVAEGGPIDGAGAVDNGDLLRLLMNIEPSVATATVNTNAFILQYATAENGQCNLATSWFDIGEQGSTTAAFSGYNNAGVGDGTTLATSTLTDTTLLGTYEERNYSDFLPVDVPPGDVIEYDWVLEATNVTVNTNYCFRMTRAEGDEFETYTIYPELETVGPPNTPTNLVFFDNERTTVLTPVLEFVSTDIAGDDIHYRVQVDDDVDFSSILIDRNSDDNFTEFENISTPSDKSPFTSGQSVRFTSGTALSATTTYWFRVQASDPDGSATTSAWSDPTSFTTDTVITVSEWFQTTGDQFSTNALSNLSTSTGAVAVTSNPGLMTSTAIDFDDAPVGNAWGEVDWNATETSGEVTIQVEYNNNGTWVLIPNSAIPGNSVGTSTSPINLRDLDTDQYNQIRLVANFVGTTLSLEDWTVRWSLRVETPTQGDLFDNQKTVSTLPVFDFVSTDPQGDGLEYEIEFSSDYNFTVATSGYNSSTSVQFANLSSGGDSSPFISGDTITFTTPGGAAFTNGSTYWWRTRARDPNGGNSWSPWAEPDSFTVDTAITRSTWFQTTQDQFKQGILDGVIASTTDSVELTDSIGEYGTVSLTNNNWTEINTTLEYDNMVVVASPEYDGSLHSSNRNARVRSKTSNTFEIKVDDYTNGFTGTTQVDYMVMEAGTWTLDEGGSGIQVIAGVAANVSAVQARSFQTNIGTEIDYSATPFSSAPVGLATVSSDNDSDWIGTHMDGNGADHVVEITTTQAQFALNASYGGVTTHGAEDIDYVIMDIADGTVNGGDFEAFNSADLVDDMQSLSGHSQSFQTGFGSAPQVTLVQNNGEDGGDGGFAIKDTAGTNNASLIHLSILEAGVGANGHTQEIASVVAFEGSSGIIKRLDSGSLSGTIAGEDIIFSDGAGPKFDNFSWSETTPGSSDITMQIEYLVSEGVYALVPDTEIPGNSVGTTSSPIDLTDVDINLYPQIRAFATLTCGGGSCPTLDDWQLEWSEGVGMSGTLREYDRSTAVATGTIKAAVNGSELIGTGSVAGGVWSFSNVTAFAGDIVTVWVDGAAEADEAVAAVVYDGVGDITGVELFEQHLSISADENATTTNALLALSDSTALGTEDVFYQVDGFNNLTVCGIGTCTDANLYVGPGNVYVASSTGGVTSTMHDFVNEGFVELDSNTITVSGSWYDLATTTVDTATINFTAATGNEGIVSSSSPLIFHALNFGVAAGTATFTIPTTLDLSDDLTVTGGIFDRDGHDIYVAGDIMTAVDGYWSGAGTTTFDGNGSKSWSDSNAVTQNIGNVFIDGSSLQVTALTDVAAYDVTIGNNDTFLGGSNTIYVGGDWTNNGGFSAGTSRIEFVEDDRTYPAPIPGSADWYSDTNFVDRIAVTVQSSELTGPVSSFPVYIDLSHLGADFWDSVQVDGDDIRVTSDDGQSEFAYEIVEFDSVARTGELHFLASSISSSTDTTFYLYHNNPSASGYNTFDTYGRDAVWSEYEAVYHMNDDPTSISNSVTDATGNGYDLSVETAALATSSGQLGLGISLVGVSGYMRATDFTWATGSPLTTSGWYKMTAASNEALWQFGTAAQPDQLYFEPWDSGTNRGQYIYGNTSGTTYTFSPRDTSNWSHFFTLGATSTSDSNYVYHDNILRETQAQTVANPGNTNANGMQVGRTGTAGSLEAEVDELRFAAVLRDTDWMTAEYNNQNNPTAFYATSSVQTYEPEVIIDEPTHVITAGGSSFYHVTFNDGVTNPYFTETSVVVNGDFTIATGTVTLPSTKLTVGASFLNSGFFMHNNAEVEFTAGSMATVTLNGTEFFNALYDVTLDGSGTFVFSDTNATTSNDLNIEDGTVVFPSGTLTIGGTLDNTGGSFTANNGSVVFTSTDNEIVHTRNSAFYDVSFGQSNSQSGWYNSAWSDRVQVKIASTSVAGSVSNFPVYVNLGDLGGTFWDEVAVDGGDIRVTSNNGKTELPVEIVHINRDTRTGELHFLAPQLSATADTSFYVYVGNSDTTMLAADSQYGSEAVWVNYEAVYHFEEDPATGVSDATKFDRDLAPAVGTPSTTPGVLGTALDTTSGNVMMSDSDWTWTSGEDLISSGLYFMSNTDNGALWQFGDGSGSNNGTYLAFMPNYDLTNRGRHFFGITSGGDYTVSPYDNSSWHHFTTIGRAGVGENNEIYEDGLQQDVVTQIGTSENPTNTGLKLGRYQTTTYNDIQIDELRFATTTPSTDWIETEYSNLTDNSTFYSTSTQTYLSVVPSFTLDEALTDADNDVFIYSANVVAPTNNFTIGGSATNVGGSYDPNNATTTFDSNDVGESFDFGDVAFYNLAFDGVGGGWTVSTTTVTNNLTLVTGASYVQATSTTMSVAGIFANQFASAATNWTNSTLVLTGGDYTVTDKAEAGDDYAYVTVSGDTDIVMWNSSIATTTVQDSSSIYMPDYGTADGTLHIYGDYTRSSGTEYWSYATDFDGTDLTGGSERTVSVLIGRGSDILLATSTILEVNGAVGATTTVAALSGIYSLVVDAGSFDSLYASYQGGGRDGVTLSDGTIVTQLTNTEFLVAAGRSGLTVDAATVNAQPAATFNTVQFSTTTAGSIYDSGWNDQVIVTVQSSAVAQTLSEYVVYVDLSSLGSNFWSGVQADGDDVRVTTDGGAELPIDLVEINTSAQTGELHFLAPSISAVEDTAFYVHFDNPSASSYSPADTYGAQAVWANYEAVYHFEEDPVSGITDKTGNGHNLLPTVGTGATTTGQIGTALDTTAGSVTLQDLGWTWQSGDDLVTSGLYFQSAFDTGALWQWGSCVTDDCMAFMPWYNNATRGYHRFGETTGNDYNFTRNAGIWHHFTTIGRAADGEAVEIYEDNVLRDSYLQTSTGENPGLTGFQVGRYQTGTYMDIDIDELRIASSVPSTSYIDTEYTNLTSPETFYATSAAPTAEYNVSTDGIPSTFWLFTSGSGNIYGEAFDNDDGDPGSIQWDDSNFAISIEGVVYSDDGVTPMSAPVCNGSTEVVTVALDGVPTYSAACDPIDGTYEVTGVVYTGEPQITAYIDSSASETQTNVAIYDEVTGIGTTAGAVLSVSRPAVVDNSVLVLIVGKDDDPAVTEPAGWTALDTLGNTTGDDIFSGIWYRVVSDASTEPASYNFTSDSSEEFSYWMGSLLNVDTVTPVDVASSWVKYQNTPTPEASEITTVTNGALVLSAWYVFNDSEVVLPVYNWEDRANNIVGSINNLSVSSQSFATAGATGTSTLISVIDARESHAGQFAFRPASSPTATGSVVAAAVTKTPIGNSAPYDVVELRDQRTGFGTAAGSSAFTVNRPAVENNDVLIAVVAREDDFTITPPAGWVSAGTRSETTGNDMFTGVWYKTVTNAGSEPTSYSFTNNDTGAEEFSYWVASFAGVDTADIFDTLPSWANEQNTSAPTASSITISQDGAYAVAAWYVIDDGAMDMPGGSWTTLAQDIELANRLLSIAGQSMTTAGATGNAVLTGGTTDDVNTVQFALNPIAVSVADGITDMDLYQNRVIVRHENLAPLTISDMLIFDNDDDSDLPFTATAGVPDTLTIEPGSGLFVWDSKEFAPDGTLTLQGGGNTVADGSLSLGTGATYTSTSTNTITIGGSFYAETGASFDGASSLVTFSATNTGQQIGSAASSTITFYDMAFTGTGGGWSINTPIVSQTNILVSTGTVSGVGNVTVETGSFYGNGIVDLTGGTTQIEQTNTFGGVNPWSFYGLTLGDGSTAGVTIPASTATTTVRSQLTINNGHALDAYGSMWNLTGSGSPFIESGTLIEGTSTVQYSGATANILRTTYNNLIIDTYDGGTVVATAPSIGLQVLGDLTIGVHGTSTLNVNTNDPVLGIGGDVYIGTLGTLEASDSSLFTALGNWDNDGVFVSNNGTVEFSRTGSSTTIAAGSSSFANVDIFGTSDYTLTENATATGNMTITTGTFTLNSGQRLAVGGTFTNSMANANATWTGSTLHLYSGTAYTINTKGTGNIYNNIIIEPDTHVRVWNSTSTLITTNASSSLYSMDHEGVDGELYIYGDLVSSAFDDHWSYGSDFDGVALSGVERPVTVTVESGGSIKYLSGSLSVVGTSTASTSIAAASATYDFSVGGDTDVIMNYYTVRDTTSNGLTFTGTPDVTDLSYGDFEVAIAAGSAMTVGGTVIDVNPAQEYTNVRFATTTAINAFNVTATGTSSSAWRFVNVPGNLGGEDKDVDPGGDPGYVTWEDSAAVINISGTVYSDEGSTAMGVTVCDGVTNSIRLSINGSTFASTTCANGTGVYTFSNISYGLGNTLTVYIDGEAEKATTITQDPISSISNFDLYEDRLVIKHEGSFPMSIADMEVWDSDDDADVLFDAEIGSPDTLVLPADTKLIVANNKEFAPDGNVTVSGGGAGGSHDGTVELYTGATFTAADGEEHSIGGSLITDAGAVFNSAQSTTTFTSNVAGRTIDTNDDGFHHLEIAGAGTFTLSDSTLTIGGDYSQAAGSVTFPNATTTVGGSFDVSGGTFDANDGAFYFTATDSGNVVAFNDNDTATLYFTGVGGGWTMTDTNATATTAFTIATGTVTLPSGVLAVGGNMIVFDTMTHNSGTIRLYDTAGSSTLRLSGNDANTVLVDAGAGDYTLIDADGALLGDLTISSGTFTAGSGTLSIGGSFDASGGVFAHNSGTLLFNSSDTGETVTSDGNDFANIVFASPTGGWTVTSDATSTSNFTLTSASDFTVTSGSRVYVGGVFTNSVGGSATTWDGTELVLDSGTEYAINSRTTSDEQYDTLTIGSNTDISSWNSNATSSSVAASGSWYSQDHASVDGYLYIYGDYHIGTTTEYWSYATDFDGTALGGSSRAVLVGIASSSAVTLDGGTLEIIGVSGATTTVTNQGTGLYSVVVSAGTLDASNYSFRNLDSDGLQLSSTVSVNSLDNGDFEQAANGTTLITLTSTVINNNASLVVTDTRFDTGGFTAGTNMSLDATTTNSWSITGSIGDLWGEAFDIDGVDACSSIRWDDSACLLTEQSHYRWRNDDGGEGAAPGTWFDSDWNKRQRIRVVNNDVSTYTDAAIKLTVTYDADMQTDFDDLRFTDASGTTTVDYWLEKVNTGASAVVWVKVPTMIADDVTELYMYYGNVSASTLSDPSETFDVYDDFEDNNISEYSGDTTLFNTAGSFAYGGGYGLDTAGNESSKATDGIARTDITVSQGQIIRYMQYVDTGAGSGDEVCTMFAVQSPVTNNQNYAVCLEQFGIDRISLVEDVENTDSTGTVLASSTISFSTGWYEVEIDWQTDDTIDVAVYDSAGTLAATTTATDGTYTSGGIGFTFWFQNGGWDSYVAWPRTDTKPATYFGAEQVDGGASWAAAQDVAGSGFLVDETARLRVSIENTGLPIENQNFQLEYAPKLTAPTCEAVSGGSFSAVPVAASCGVNDICMTASASTTDGDPTTDHLVVDQGEFIAGEIIEDVSNQTSNLDVDQDEYTELEYALKITNNAFEDSYCFRVTDAGSELDSYARLPELTLAFDPVIDVVNFNQGLDIVLSPGGTATILATTTVTDYNGYTDLVAATTTFYRTSVTAACTPDDNNCYLATSTGMCSFTNCSGSSCTLSCQADFQYHTDPTDFDGGEFWYAFMEVSDIAGGIDFGTSLGIDVLTLRSIDVQNAIGYGVVDINQNTGSFNPNITLLNQGNEAVDVEISGTDMSDGVASAIPAAQQIFATSTFDYASCVVCSTLSNIASAIEVDLSKPSSASPPVSDDIYWGIEVPFGTASNPHTGINTFTAISD